MSYTLSFIQWDSTPPLAGLFGHAISMDTLFVLMPSLTLPIGCLCLHHLPCCLVTLATRLHPAMTAAA